MTSGIPGKAWSGANATPARIQRISFRDDRLGTRFAVGHEPAAPSYARRTGLMTNATTRMWRLTSRLGACAVAVVVSVVAIAARQAPPTSAPTAPTAAAPQPAPLTDPLGRSTPRGAVRGFLEAARTGDHARAALYLDTRRSDAAELARKVFVVLDARLPARLQRISDEPEGSDPVAPNREIVGIIEGSAGPAEVVLERVQRSSEPGPIWLISPQTIAAALAQYDEIANSRWNGIVPTFLIRTRFAGLRLVDILTILAGLPLLYFATIFLNRALTPLVGLRFRKADSQPRSVLPASARLLLVVIAGRWLSSTLPLSLAVRQIWSTLTALIIIATAARLLMLLNAEVERHVLGRIAPSSIGAAASLLRLLRRGADVLIIFAAVIVTLFHFGVDPTPALAGLGVGGIAVALAAQKTLENVIAGASIIFDQAVRVGDFLKMGDMQGTVDHIGLRSTRIRTLDRTVVSVPNGQIANVSLETLSARDKFWFHPVVGLVYETTPEQLRQVVDHIRQLLDGHPLVDASSVRVRFIRLGAFSLDIDVFAYLLARDWNHFLEIQEQLLFGITEIVSRVGTSIAFPSQTTYVANATVQTVPAR
jgi:MscS family membrane protein